MCALAGCKMACTNSIREYALNASFAPFVSFNRTNADALENEDRKFTAEKLFFMFIQEIFKMLVQKVRFC